MQGARFRELLASGDLPPADVSIVQQLAPNDTGLPHKTGDISIHTNSILHGSASTSRLAKLAPTHYPSHARHNASAKKTRDAVTSSCRVFRIGFLLCALAASRADRGKRTASASSFLSVYNHNRRHAAAPAPVPREQPLIKFYCLTEQRRAVEHTASERTGRAVHMQRCSVAAPLAKPIELFVRWGMLGAAANFRLLILERVERSAILQPERLHRCRPRRRNRRWQWQW